MTDNRTPEHLLSEVFGYSGFRGDQRAVIETALTNGHGDDIETLLRSIDVATMTPLEALNTLADLAERME